MKAVIYKGPDINLGRFESVKNGQVLGMTDDEYLCVVGDSRFVEASPEAIEAAKKAEIENQKKQAAEQAKKDEAARKAFAKRQSEEDGTPEAKA